MEVDGGHEQAGRSDRLIVIVAPGARELRWERDRLQDAVDIKIEILRGLEKAEGHAS